MAFAVAQEGGFGTNQKVTSGQMTRIDQNAANGLDKRSGQVDTLASTIDVTGSLNIDSGASITLGAGATMIAGNGSAISVINNGSMNIGSSASLTMSNGANFQTTDGCNIQLNLGGSSIFNLDAGATANINTGSNFNINGGSLNFTNGSGLVLPAGSNILYSPARTVLLGSAVTGMSPSPGLMPYIPLSSGDMDSGWAVQFPGFGMIGKGVGASVYLKMPIIDGAILTGVDMYYQLNGVPRNPSLKLGFVVQKRSLYQSPGGSYMTTGSVSLMPAGGFANPDYTSPNYYNNVGKLSAAVIDTLPIDVSNYSYCVQVRDESISLGGASAGVAISHFRFTYLVTTPANTQ